jgi:polysaccharide pyruvyl transferase WcaK-like protein
MRFDPTGQRIALFGHFGAGNLGNEATLRAMMYNLRKHVPSAEISCVCSGPENTASEYNISAAPIRASFPNWSRFGVSHKEDKPARNSNRTVFGIAPEAWQPLKVLAKLRTPLRICAYPLREAYRWVRAIAALRESSALVMTGTGMLGDPSLHYEIFRWAVAAKLCRCKLLFVSVGAGAIRQPLSRWLVKAALKLADYRSYRDSLSKDSLAAIGLDVRNDPIYPDLAFSLPRTVVPVDYGAGGRGAVIGVGLVDYYGASYYGASRSANDQAAYHDYLGSVASFVAAMLGRNYAVRILIGDFVYDQGVRQDLKRTLEERGVTYEDGKIIDIPAFSVDELLLQVSSLDIVVSSRFHNLVLALMLKKPVFAVSYHAEKFQPLMEGVGLSEFYYDIGHIDIDELIAKVIKLQENAPAISVRTARRTESYRTALDEQYERMLKVLSVPSNPTLAEA